jgi:hypothetical protein
MPQDVRFVCPNRPGAAETCFSALAGAGINVLGACGDLRPGETWGHMHVLVEVGDAARAVIEGIGFEVTGVQDVAVHRIDDRPGSLLELYKRYADKEDNVEVLYMSGDSMWIVGTETMREAMPGRRMDQS